MAVCSSSISDLFAWESGHSWGAGLALATNMRTKVFTAVAAAAICATFVVGMWIWRGAPKASLTKYLSRELPPSIIVAGTKSSGLEKDPELFWHLEHSPSDFDAIVTNNFRMCDAADREFVQKSLKNVFPGKFTPESNDAVYSRDGRDFDVFVLTKPHRTNSFVMVLTK